MKSKMKRLLKGTAASILAGSLFLQGLGGSMAEVSAVGKASPMAKQGTVLCEEGFESGNTGKWAAKEGASISAETDSPRSGKYCMKISGRTMAASGAKLEIGNMLREDHYLSVSAYAKYVSGPDKKKIQITLFCGGKYYTLAGKELAGNRRGELSGSMAVPSGADLSDAILFFETPWTQNPTAEQDLMDIYVDDTAVTLHAFCDTSSYPSLKELYKSQFLIGLAVPDKVLDTPVYSRLFEQQCSSMTMENEMKPAYIMDEAASKGNLGEYKEHVALNFQSYKNGLEYAKKHGIAVRGHTLVWHSQTPDWFFYEGYDVSGELAGRELMLKRMENYIKEVIAWTEENYPGVIYAWDVVNEAVADYFGAGAAPMRQEDSLWYQTIGEDFVQQAFAYARKYTKQYANGRSVKLFYNDYNEYFPAKRDWIVALLKPSKEAGNLDGVGMQSHFDTKHPLEGDSGYMTAVRKFRDELGTEIHVTELDIGIAEGDTEESQGVYYQKFMEALLKEKKAGANITSVTFWGLTDGLSWRPGEDCLLFRDDLSRKPAFEGVVKAIGSTEDVIRKINGIGDVAYTEACKAKIAEARDSYDGLTDAQKTLVPAEILRILEDAETEYRRLEEAGQNPPPVEKATLREEHIAKIPAQAYTGKPAEPKVTVTYSGKELEEGKDYTVSYKNNIQIGQAAAVITGTGDYQGTAEKSFAITVKKNQVHVVGDYKYKITDAKTNGKGTVALIGPKSSAAGKRLKKISVLSAVSIGGKKFNVTSVGNAAFKGCANAADIIIGKNVKAIGDSAFHGCTKATDVTVGGSVTKIGAKAFYNCKKLRKIAIKTTKLKSVGKNALKNIHAKAVIQVPKSKLKAYRKLLKSKGQKKGVKISL